MLKKSLIILSTVLYFSVLITGFPLKIDIISSEDNPFFSLENINHFVYAQDDSDKSESGSDKSESGSDKSESGSDKSESGSDKSESGSDKSESGSDKSESGSDKSESGSDKSESCSDKSESGRDKSESGSDKSESGSDNSNFDSNDEKSKENTEGNTPNFQSSPHLKDANGSDENSKENNEMNTPDFLASPDGDTAVDPPVGGDNPPPVGGDNPPPVGGDNPPPVGGDNPPPVGGDNPPPVGGDNPPPVGGDNPPPVGGDNPDTSKDKNNIKDKINLEFDKITKIISKTKNKIIVKDDSDSEKEIIIVSDPTCPTQSETIELNGIIVPKGIRLLANFYPCIIQNGGITMNIPESPHLNLAVIYIDNNIDNHAGTLISPSKIQSIDKNQGLFSIELDKKMKGNDPITGELTTLEKINGLALYNSGNEPIEFKEGSSVALTATFTK